VIPLASVTGTSPASATRRSVHDRGQRDAGGYGVQLRHRMERRRHRGPDRQRAPAAPRLTHNIRRQRYYYLEGRRTRQHPGRRATP